MASQIIELQMQNEEKE